MKTSSQNTNPFNLYEDDRVALMIDGGALYKAHNAVGIKNIDYEKLRDSVADNSNLRRAQYFCEVPANPEEHNPIAKLVDWLDFHGFRVVSQKSREIYDAVGERNRRIGSIIPRATVEMIEAAESVDHIILLAGSADYVAGIEAVQRRGVKVTVGGVFAENATSSDYLRRQADEVVELSKVFHLWERQYDKPYTSGHVGSIQVQDAIADSYGNIHRTDEAQVVADHRQSNRRVYASGGSLNGMRGTLRMGA